jgi:hypothetical protein
MGMTWAEELQTYDHPKGKTFPEGYIMPDGIVSSSWYFGGFNPKKREKNRGVTLQLITQKAYDLFPDVPREGPTKGLVWFPSSEIGNLCALEEREGLCFHGHLIG